MTKEEIIALIDSAIAGQGNQVDAGSVLDKILKGVIGLIVPTGQKYKVEEGFDSIPKDIVDKLEAGDVIISVGGNCAYVRYADDSLKEVAEIDAGGLTISRYEDGEYVDGYAYHWNIQADWNEANSNDPAYINNKPTIPQGPLIIEATIDSENPQSFTVDDESEITTAMSAGRIVMLHVNNSVIYSVVSFGMGAGQSRALWMDGNYYRIID